MTTNQLLITIYKYYKKLLNDASPTSDYVFWVCASKCKI